MKLENYRKEDVDEAIEARREALHHLMAAEKYLWTDDIEEAIKHTVDMHLSLIELNKMQSRKRLDDLIAEFKGDGITIEIKAFKRKKTD